MTETALSQNEDRIQVNRALMFQMDEKLNHLQCAIDAITLLSLSMTEEPEGRAFYSISCTIESIHDEMRENVNAAFAKARGEEVATN